MLVLDRLSIHIAGRPLIDNAQISLPDGAKTGFVGHNGTGKTTLFRVISGEVSAIAGEVSLPKFTSLGLVAQEAPDSDQNLIDTVMSANKELSSLLLEAETAQDPDRIAAIYERLGDIDAYSASSRAQTILFGLGFDPKAQLRPVSSFSGGWRMRVALAAMLFSEPDFLLLDEPTNYLDIEGTTWLIDTLKKYSKTVLLISHDRDLLNQVATDILHLENRKLTLWRGNYDQFERQRSEKIILQQKQAAKQEAARAHMEAFVERFRAKASKAKQAQSRLKLLKKMSPVLLAKEEHVQPFSFPKAKKSASSPLITLSNVDVGYEDAKPILRNLTLRIDHDDRIALLGANGNGKSTFAKLISKHLSPQKGIMTYAPELEIAFFAQHQLDFLFPEETPIEHMRRHLPLEPESKIRSHIAQMGLATEKMMTRAKLLSGGEKARLLMGLATFSGANLLILDEPTNHLDIDSRFELIRALNEFSGAVILIAHDRYLIEATMDRLWKVGEGKVAPYEGDMETYRQEVLDNARQNKKQKSEDKKLELKQSTPIKKSTTPALNKKSKKLKSLKIKKTS